MPCEPSIVARKVAGTFVEDQPEPAAPLFRWVQRKCRNGRLQEALAQFSQQQEESLQPRLVVVESVNADGIVCVIPGRQRDHESPQPYLVELRCLIDPSSGTIRRF